MTLKTEQKPRCRFCKIVEGQTEETILYQDEFAVVFEDIYPRSAIHLIVASRRHIHTMTEIDDPMIMKAFVSIGQMLVARFGLNSVGYTYGFNGGGKQTVDHLHAQLVSGTGD